MCEAFFGAIYLDKGLGAARTLLAQGIFPRRADLPHRRCWMHAVTEPYTPPDPLERDEASAEQVGLARPLPARPAERTGLRFV